MLNKVLFFILSILFIKPIFAVSITEKGVSNIGSGAAYVMTCETNKFLPVGTASDYIITIRKTFRQDDADAILRAYQNSLHSKKLYSPSKNIWVDMKIDKESCLRLGNTLPSMIDFMKKMSAEYPN
jgi:hypothetical protein